MIKKATLHPSRIGCPLLPGTMKGIVMSIGGVKDVAIVYEERSLLVTFDDAATSVEAIVKKIGEETGIAMGSDIRGGEDRGATC